MFIIYLTVRLSVCYETNELMELCTLYLRACQVKVAVGDSGLCCCTCVTYLERQLTHLCVHMKQMKMKKETMKTT